MAYQPGPSYRPQGLNDPHAQAVAGAQAVGRSSPMPPVPQVAQSNLGQPGQMGYPGQMQAQQYTQQQQQQHAMYMAGAAGGVIAGGENGHAPAADKGPDYVYFERRPNQFSEMTRGKATAAKMKLELYYKEAVEGVVGRKER